MRGRKSEILFLGLVGAVFALAGCGPSGKKVAAPPAPKVTVATPEEREVLEYEDVPGRVEAIEKVEIKARVNGYLTKVNFVEGTEVQKGDLLFTIDPREYQAEVDSATAALQQAQAKYAQSQSDYERAKQLSKSTVIAKQELETQGTAVLEAAGGVRGAQAALARAQLNLEYTQIRSPITGKIGDTNLTEGNLIAEGDALTSVVSQSPVYVYFEAPERAILRWDKEVKESGGKGLTSKLRAQVGLLNEEGFPREGKVNFSDNMLNTNTGTLQMRAVLDNQDRSLRVGLYARVRISLDLPRQSLLVPERAVGVDQGQRFIYVVTPENKVEYRKVITGQIYDGKLSITEGLKPDDRVVVEGLLALRPGLTVQPETAPAAQQ